MDVSIIIVNYHMRNLVRECIKSIHASKPACTYEIIVVDNSQDKGLKSMLAARYPEAQYVAMDTNVGLSRANNAGAKKAKGTYCLFLNPDILVREGAITKLFQFMESKPRVGIAGPRLRNPDGSHQQSYFRYQTPMTAFYRRTFLSRLSRGKRYMERYEYRNEPTPVQEVEWLLGASLFVRKEAADAIGYMDEQFMLYMEDLDWCKRFREGGWGVYYCSDAEMIHLYKRQSAESWGIKALFSPVTWYHFASACKYFIKHRKTLYGSPQSGTSNSAPSNGGATTHANTSPQQ